MLPPGNRAKPCKFRYVKSVRNFMWKLCYRKDNRAMRPIRAWVPSKFSGLPDYDHGYYSQIFSWAFFLIDPMNVPTKFEVRSFTRSWNNKGYPKNLDSTHFITPASRHVAWKRFCEDTTTSAEVIGAQTLNFRSKFKFSRLNFRGTPVAAVVCASTCWSICNACKNLRG